MVEGLYVSSGMVLLIDKWIFHKEERCVQIQSEKPCSAFMFNRNYMWSCFDNGVCSSDHLKLWSEKDIGNHLNLQGKKNDNPTLK
jgi:hypothetical protein